MILVDFTFLGHHINFDSSGLIIALAMILSFVTILSFVLPLVKRRQEKEIFKAAIHDQRKKLFQQAKEDETKLRSTSEKKRLSARESLEALFKLERLGGVSIRDEVIQAGYRSPNAPLLYVLWRLILPVIFSIIAGLFLSHTEKEISSNIKFIAIFGIALFGFFIPKLILKSEIQKRQEEIQLTFPDALDMMLICVQGGISLEASISRITTAVIEHSKILAEELGLLSAELAMLNDRRGAFQGFAARAGIGSARTFANAMIQAEQYGTSISQALRVLAEELRDMRMAEAERKAASLPPKLTVPMILFFLPALFVIILAPAFIIASQTFKN